MAKISAQGTTVTFNSASVGQVKSIQFSGGDVTIKDRTTLASTAKEKAPGLADYGNCTIELFRDNDDAGMVALMAAKAAGTTANLVVTLSASTLNALTQSAFVVSISLNADLDSDVMGTVVFEFTGAEAWA